MWPFTNVLSFLLSLPFYMQIAMLALCISAITATAYYLLHLRRLRKTARATDATSANGRVAATVGERCRAAWVCQFKDCTFKDASADKADAHVIASNYRITPETYDEAVNGIPLHYCIKVKGVAE